MLLMKSGSSGEGDTLGLGLLPAETLEYLGIALFCSMAFVYAGAKIAPRHRLYAAGGLVLLWVLTVGIVVGASVVLVSTDDRYYIEDWGWAQLVAITSLNVAGSVVALRAIYLDERESA
ncbi:MAG: hypothetical protein WD557_01345 [Dehalococcoidia bacterium]